MKGLLAGILRQVLIQLLAEPRQLLSAVLLLGRVSQVVPLGQQLVFEFRKPSSFLAFLSDLFLKPLGKNSVGAVFVSYHEDGEVFSVGLY